jgi:hypothetical protein
MPDEKFGWLVEIRRNDLFQPLFRCLAGVILFGAMRIKNEFHGWHAVDACYCFGQRGLIQSLEILF